ncbi:MAG: NAD(P)/FAD-dependent oxidoreductase [Sphingomonadaceae bacterium]
MALRGGSAATRITFRLWIAFYKSIFAASRPFFDLGIRLYLAQAFVMSSVMAVASGDAMASDSMMSASAMAASGGLGGLFISLGLFTRLSSAALLLSILAQQSAGGGGDSNLLVIALLGWYILRGPDALSIDRALALGMRASALPLSKPVMRVLDGLREVVAPAYLLVARLWLAAALAGFAILPDWVPTDSFGWLPRGLALVTALLVASGFGLAVILPLLQAGLAGMHVMGHGTHLYLILFLIILAYHDGGLLTIDRRIAEWLHAHFLFDRPKDIVPADWPHVVIVGAGFGGLACAAKLRALPVRVTLIDRHNYHLFQPLLYQVATAGLSPADVATPIRGLFLDDHNISVRLGTVTSVDTAAKQVGIGRDRLDYDYLVLATGAAHSYFGRDEWAPFAPGLKRIEDGVAARSDILTAFERAEACADNAEQARLLTFVVIGGGPTGVELAGSIAELATAGLSNHYRAIDPGRARIILVQAGDRVLPSFPETLSARAKASLEDLGVEVRLGARVTGIDDDGVMIGDERIGAATVLWAAGVVASPAADWLGSDKDRAGRVVVGEDLSVAGHQDVFAIGDTAASNGWKGKAVPGLAPAAKQSGAYVAKVIRARLEASQPPPPFAYQHMGSLATIGRKSAVADFGFIQFSGALAWWLWGAIHVAFLVGVRNRVAVIVNWIWCYLSFRLSVQLITGELDMAQEHDREVT